MQNLASVTFSKAKAKNPLYRDWWRSVPTDRRSFRTGPKKDFRGPINSGPQNCQKELSLDPGTIIRFSKWLSWNFNDKPTYPPDP